MNIQVQWEKNLDASGESGINDYLWKWWKKIVKKPEFFVAEQSTLGLPNKLLQVCKLHPLYILVKFITYF